MRILLVIVLILSTGHSMPCHTSPCPEKPPAPISR